VSHPHQFLVDLAHFLPVATAAQLLRHYFAGNVEALRRALRAAQGKGFIELSTELVRPWSHTGEPIVTLKAGDPALAAGPIAYQASQRWNAAPVPMLVVRGTATLAALHGGMVCTIATGHLSHELAIAEIFLTKRLGDPAFEWSLVHARPGAGILPDALAGSMAFEVIGRYGSASVAAKISLGGSMNLELW
jgi:hypothetical protein